MCRRGRGRCQGDDLLAVGRPERVDEKACALVRRQPDGRVLQFSDNVLVHVKWTGPAVRDVATRAHRFAA
jgi:hypothetical protein